MLASVVMAAEKNAVIGDFPHRPEAESLKTAAVRQNGAVPFHEFMESAGFFYQLMTGTQIQMICIGQQNFGAGLRYFIGGGGLYRRLSAHGHENRRGDHAVCRFHLTEAGVAASLFNFEFQHNNITS